MSKPELFPKPTTSGITVDPRTLERIIPESRRPDGTVRKEIKIRPGYTPQEDVQRFRGTRQAQLDANALPKGHIIGWVPPSSATTPKSTAGSKSAKKNEKRKEKRKAAKDAEVQSKIKDSWEDSDEGEPEKQAEKSNKPASKSKDATEPADKGTDALTEKLEKLDVR